MTNNNSTETIHRDVRIVVGAIFLVGITLTIICHLPRFSEGPVVPKLSTAVTHDLASTFRSHGVTEISVIDGDITTAAIADITMNGVTYSLSEDDREKLYKAKLVGIKKTGGFGFNPAFHITVADDAQGQTVVSVRSELDQDDIDFDSAYASIKESILTMLDSAEKQQLLAQERSTSWKTPALTAAKQ